MTADPDHASAPEAPPNSEVPSSPSGPRARAASPRGEGPWAWQAKTALRRISDGEGFSSVTSRLAAYVAVCWAASDSPQPTGIVTVSVASIARRAGLSPRSARAALRELEAAGLIVTEHRRAGSVHLPSRITICSTRNPPCGAPGGTATIAAPVRQPLPEEYGSHCRRGTATDDIDPLPASEEEGRGMGPSKGPMPSSYKRRISKNPATSSRTRSRSLEAARRGAVVADSGTTLTRHAGIDVDAWLAGRGAR